MKRQALIATLMGSALALVMPIAASAQNGQFASRVGLITDVQANQVTLNNGMTVYLHEGTIINPTGVTLYRGMRVRVFGTRYSHWHLDARRIDLIGARGQYRR
ncbi:MAG TPA: hypothetical protein VMD07_03530 [Candidatus Acidoferrales bacterium]|nr:hypothetical protein [Candidatus Acidoferrales bacterium]